VIGQVKWTAKVKIDNINLTLSENKRSDNINKGYKVVIRFRFGEAMPAGISLIVMWNKTVNNDLKHLEELLRTWMDLQLLTEAWLPFVKDS
jgi:hypothetical protein